jgi:hypothetical protein
VNTSAHQHQCAPASTSECKAMPAPSTSAQQHSSAQQHQCTAAPVHSSTSAQQPTLVRSTSTNTNEAGTSAQHHQCAVASNNTQPAPPPAAAPPTPPPGPAPVSTAEWPEPAPGPGQHGADGGQRVFSLHRGGRFTVGALSCSVHGAGWLVLPGGCCW